MTQALRAFVAVLLLWAIRAGAGGDAIDVVRRDAVRRSADACARVPDGCEIVVKRQGREWYVRIEPLHRDANGELLYVPGGNFNYYYDADGRFAREMPDL